jgi:hypothetical protein
MGFARGDQPRYWGPGSLDGNRQAQAPFGRLQRLRPPRAMRWRVLDDQIERANFLVPVRAPARRGGD